MDWRLVLLVTLALSRRLHGQNETAVASARSVSHSPSPTAAPYEPPATGGGSQPLLMAVSVSLLSVVCAGVLVTVVVVLLLRARRACRRWRRTSHTEEKTRGRASGNGATVHLLSVALSNHSEWCRPRSLSPASSAPHSPLPSTLHSTLPLPSTLPPSPTSTHDYSEIASLPAVVHHRPHVYEEVDEEDLVKTEVHLYSLLEGPTHHTSPSPPALTGNKLSFNSSGRSQQTDPDSERDNHHSSRDTLPSSRGSSVSIQGSNPNWVLSPVARQPRPPRRVVPYRVSLILPLWEVRERGPSLPTPLAGRHPISSSCQGLEESGRYNHLEGVAGYGSLEVKGVYATLEPFVGAEQMRPRSRSCDARLYNHLQH